MYVTFTRAKSKLIIFGSRKTLQAAPLLDDFFKLMDSKGWILQLPSHADQLHESAHQTSSKRRSDVATLQAYSKENASRPTKKSRKNAAAEEGLAKGRHILKDLFNEGK